MRTKLNSSSLPWNLLGAPQAGAVSALAIAKDSGYTVFIGTRVGLYRSSGFDGSTVQGWKRLNAAPIGIMSLAVSPNYVEDHSLVAGTEAGIWISQDSGETWQAASMPISNSMILSICYSPNYLVDGILFAGTLEDGVVYSDTRGEKWHNKSFGLLDSTVFSLAISPDFIREETIFAGTETAIYYSYNNGRAWKQLNFPESAVAALSLAISPNFAQDQTLYAGTEDQGLYRSTDQGVTWHKLGLPASCVNALLISQTDSSTLAATEAGIFQSDDQGETWKCLVEIPDAICLAIKDDLIVAGLVDQGVWLSTNQVDWNPVPNLVTRTLIGLVLSTQFEQDRMAFMYGPQEGIWRTEDGGHSWESLNETLPGLEIHALAVSPNFSENLTMVAASQDGVLLSEDAGNRWERICEEPARLISFSPNGKILTVSLPGKGIQSSENLGISWQSIPGSWEAGGSVAALAVTNLNHYHIAHLEGVGETISFWQGRERYFEKVLSQSAGRNPIVSFWIPSGPAADRPWYASLGKKVWRFSSRMEGSSIGGIPSAETSVFPDTFRNENILTLTGVQDRGKQILFACTSQHVFKSLEAKSWTMVHDFGNEPAISFALSPSYLSNKNVYALLLGGSFCQGIIR